MGLHRPWVGRAASILLAGRSHQPPDEGIGVGGVRVGGVAPPAGGMSRPAPAGRCPSCSAGLRVLLAEDLRRPGNLLRRLAELPILEPIGLVLLYRVSHAAYWSPLRPLGWIARAISIALYGADIHPRACLGRRLHIAHVNGIVIGGGVVTGDDLTLFARVTIGAGKHFVWPEVGSRVTLFTGACVAGPARLGDGARVGANVFFDGVLPAEATAHPQPAAVSEPRGTTP